MTRAPPAASAPAHALPTPVDTRIAVETPEHVAFHHRAAGPAARGLAWGIDAVLRAVLLGVLVGLAAALGLVAGSLGVGLGAVLVAWFVIDWGWYTLWEGAWSGQSPGKLLLGLRVIREDGAPIGWREAWLRNLVRAADALPLFYVVGALAAAWDPRFRRVGDIVAGTVVVYTPHRAVTEARPDVAPPTADERLGIPARLRTPRALRLALERWLAAGERWGSGWSEAVAERVAPRLTARTGVTAATPRRTLELVAAVGREHEDEGAALLRARADDHRALDALLTDVRRHGLGADRVGELLARYRDVCADLGRMRAAQATPEQVAAVEELCGRAHEVVYRGGAIRRRGASSRVLAYLLAEIPAEIRASRRWIGAAAALFLIPGLVAFTLASTDPSFAERVLPPETLAQMEMSYRESVGRAPGDDAMMAGFYVWNNVGIALRSVAAGVFFGLGSAWVLLQNGLLLGAMTGYVTWAGHGGNLLRFVVGHTAWELTGLVVAGAGGLRLGWSIVAPGDRTRAASVRAAAPSVARLSIGAAVMLLVAASIEGFWSGQTHPDALKAAFGAAQVVLVLLWFSGILTRGRAA